MDRNTYLSLSALLISIISLLRQVYIEWISNTARIKIKLSRGCLTDVDGKTGFFDVTVNNRGRRVIYINRPFICIDNRNPYYKRLEKSPLIEFPYKLEPWANIRFRIADLMPEKDGQYLMNREDALIIDDTILQFDKDESKFIPTVSEPKKEVKASKNKKLKSYAHIEITDSNSKTFKSKRITVLSLINMQKELHGLFDYQTTPEKK